MRFTTDLPTLSRSTSSLTTLASARGNSSAARSVSMSILNVERISTISTPRHNSRLASGCPCVCCRQYAQVSAKHSHDFWLVIPRLAIHFCGSNSPALLICALLTATIVLSFRDQTCRNQQIVTILRARKVPSIPDVPCVGTYPASPAAQWYILLLITLRYPEPALQGYRIHKLYEWVPVL